MKSMKKLSLTAAAVAMMLLTAAPAMADQELQDQQNDPSAIAVEEPLAAPAIADEVQDHSNDPSGTVKEEPIVEEEPIKDPGISLCDFEPTSCQDTEDSSDEHGHDSDADPDTDDPNPVEEEPYKDPGIRLCDITPTACQDTDDDDDRPEWCNSPHLIYDPVCDEPKDGSGDDDPDADDPDPVEEEEPKEEGASAPGAVKAGELSGGTTTTAVENDASAQEEAVSASDEAWQMAYGPTNPSPETYGCPWDYDYIEYDDSCFPGTESLGVYPMIIGEKPWPDSAGGYVGLPGHFVGDTLQVLGAIVQTGLSHYVEDALVDFGEDGGPIGWGIQGLGYTLGFAGDVVGLATEAAGQIAGAVTEHVGDVVDAIGDAAEDAWDEITSWF